MFPPTKCQPAWTFQWVNSVNLWTKGYLVKFSIYQNFFHAIKRESISYQQYCFVSQCEIILLTILCLAGRTQLDDIKFFVLSVSFVHLISPKLESSNSQWWVVMNGSGKCLLVFKRIGKNWIKGGLERFLMGSVI